MGNMMRHDNICVARQILQHYDVLPAHARILLSTFMIVEHADDAFASAQRTEVETRLQHAASNVLHLLRDEGSCALSFQTAFEDYREKFLEWKRTNKKELFTMLALTYHDYQMTLQILRVNNRDPSVRHGGGEDSGGEGSGGGEESGGGGEGSGSDGTDATAAESAIAHVEEAMQKLVIRAERLGYSVEDLRDASPPSTHRPSTVSIDEGVLDIGRRAFWDVFRQRFAAHDFSQLRVVLEEIRDRMKALTPNRRDLHTMLDESIDTDLIIPQIEAGAFAPAQFHALVEFIVQNIQSLEASADTVATKEWHARFIEQCRTGQGYNELLPTFFRWVYDRLQMIERDTLAFRDFIVQRDPQLNGTG